MKQKIIDELKNKNILILGFGREGKSTYSFVSKHVKYKSLAISDLNEVKDEEILKNKKIKKYTGKNYLNAMNDYDVIIKTPGISLKDNFDESIIKKITSQTELFLKYAGKKTIGITGTKGKSTTATLTYEILKNSGFNTKLVGNIGIPALDFAEEVEKIDYFVYELSGHQLEHVTTSPHIAVMLNIYEEHLDHFGTYEKYKKAKNNIHKFQIPTDYYIYNFDMKNDLIDEENDKQNLIGVSLNKDISSNIENMTTIKEYNIHSKINEKELALFFPKDTTKLKGIHNIYNAMIAITIGNILGIKEENILKTLENFEPLPHRLENIGTYNGVTYIDDSISTIPEATIKAIETIPNIETILIGGMDREINYSKLIEYIKNTKVKNIILMYDTGKRIKDDLANEVKHNIVYMENLEEAVKYAVNITNKNMACVMSPAAASYGAFKNFEHRGDMFKEYILKYTSSK